MISLGWAVAHPQQLAGVVLTNTAVHQPSGSRIPPALRLALHPAVHRWGTTTSDAFLRVTHSLAHPPLAADVRSAFMAPYRGAGRRAGVGNFVADIPADASHPSFPALSRVAEGLRGLRVPALMLWGPRDPIFSDRYLKDLIGRLPHAKVHRFEGAGHLVAEDRDIAAPVFEWLAGCGRDSGPAQRTGPTARPTTDAELRDGAPEPGAGFRPFGRRSPSWRRDPRPGIPPSRKWPRTAASPARSAGRSWNRTSPPSPRACRTAGVRQRQPGEPDGSARAWT